MHVRARRGSATDELLAPVEQLIDLIRRVPHLRLRAQAYDDALILRSAGRRPLAVQDEDVARRLGRELLEDGAARADQSADHRLADRHVVAHVPRRQAQRMYPARREASCGRRPAGSVDPPAARHECVARLGRLHCAGRGAAQQRWRLRRRRRRRRVRRAGGGGGALCAHGGRALPLLAPPLTARAHPPPPAPPAPHVPPPAAPHRRRPRAQHRVLGESAQCPRCRSRAGAALAAPAVPSPPRPPPPTRRARQGAARRAQSRRRCMHRAFFLPA
mmetsp:Transcript_65041/g.178466  ORF Transcript_65041/g.178466 Transcript_65041/m.178466 type:complete len:274 (-) Transcript_65041:279-1100(-)